MRPDQLGDYRSPSDARLHPDGARAAFVVTQMDLDEDRYVRRIWLWDGDEARPLTSGDMDTTPRWSPDGTRLAFLRKSAGDYDLPQVAILRIDGGEATIISDFELGASDIEWSPDGSRIALNESAGPIWVVDLESGAPTKLSENGFYPVWSPDGTQLAYGTTRTESFDLMLRPLDMSQPEQVLLERDYNLRTADWTSDGTIVFRVQIPDKGMDLMRWSDPTDESTIEILLDGGSDEISPMVSPNGRWLAYVSNQSGRDEIYVTAFPQPEGIVQVSVAGGANPAWSTDGSELFYFQGTEFIAVTITTDPDFQVAGRRTLFEGSFRQYRWQRQYDVHPDGEHFLMILDPPGGHLEVILNWFEDLKNKASGEG